MAQGSNSRSWRLADDGRAWQPLLLLQPLVLSSDWQVLLKGGAHGPRKDDAGALLLDVADELLGLSCYSCWSLEMVRK